MRRPCIMPGCNKLSLDGAARCPAHLRQQGATKNRARQSRAHPSHGAAALTRRALNHMGYGRCAKCRRHCIAPALEVDHIIPLADGGTDRASNTQALCLPCHRAKSTAEHRARARRHYQ